MIEPVLLSLDDSELSAIMASAQPLAPPDRDLFMRDVAAELAKHSERGPGLVGRICATTQRRYFSPPDLKGSVSRWGR